MDDRLKFRVPMFSDKDKFQEFQYIELGDSIECTLCGYNGESQQCTGLKDKNGILIYEGDIVKTFHGDLAIIKYGEFIDYDIIQLKKEYYNSYNDGRKSIGFYASCIELDEDNSLDNMTDVWITVIGNIHQNPELLNEKQHLKK